MLRTAVAAALAFVPLLRAADPLLDWLNRIAVQHLDARERAVAAIVNPAAADARRAMVRAKLLELLGGLPDYAGPLNARKTGEIAAAASYTIEKVLFESLPGVFVTGNVYRPTLVTGRRLAGVLIPAGHTQEGKPEMQVLAANLAMQGFVAFTYDPIGQGEREQTYLPQLGRALSGGGGNEHLELGARSLAIGQSVARYFIHDARRALDYLASRPDVDAARLGVAGCSGGGCIATYLAALDERIRAAAPGCWINTFRRLFPGPTADSEMSLPRFLASGLDLADFFTLPAPRVPWLMMATTEDYFPPEGAEPVYRETRRIYDLYGAGDRVRYFVGSGPHGTPKESREAIYAWMARWLKDSRAQVAVADRAVRQYTSRELRVTPSGNVADLPGSRKLWEVIRGEYERLRAPLGLDALRAGLLAGGLGAIARAAPPVMRPAGETVSGAGFRVEPVVFESEPGIEITGRFYRPAASVAAQSAAVLVVEERRLRVPLYVQPSQSTAAVCEALTRAGHLVLELSPRDSPAADEGRPFLGNWVTNERADLVGRNLATMRANDLLRGADLLAAQPGVAELRGYARGGKGIWLLLAASAEPRLRRLWLDRLPVSYRAAFEAPLASHLFDALLPGFARHWDLADLMKATPAHLYRTDPVNWMNQVTGAEGEGVRYRAVGEPVEDVAGEWLRGGGSAR